MFWPDVLELLKYWLSHPPEHMSIRMLLQVFTTWKPSTPEQQQTPFNRESAMMLTQQGFFRGSEQLPERVRNLINIAEEMKKKMKLPTDS
jgi:hypothetical protein